MRTTLNIDPQLLNEVVKTTGEKDRGRAVNRAMEEYIRRQKIERLIALAGKIEFRDDWEKRHQLDLELEEEHRRSRNPK